MNSKFLSSHADMRIKLRQNSLEASFHDKLRHEISQLYVELFTNESSKGRRKTTSCLKHNYTVRGFIIDDSQALIVVKADHLAKQFNVHWNFISGEHTVEEVDL